MQRPGRRKKPVPYRERGVVLSGWWQWERKLYVVHNPGLHGLGVVVYTLLRRGRRKRPIAIAMHGTCR